MQEKVDGKEDTFTQRFSQLNKRDAELRALQKQLDERASRVKSLEDAFAKAKRDPLSLVNELGLDLDQLYQWKQTGQVPKEEVRYRELKTELDQLKELRMKEEEERRQDAIRRQLDEFKQSVAKSLGDSEKYELLRNRGAGGGVEEVMSYLADHFDKTQEILPLDSALESLEKRFEEDVRKLLQLNKVKQWYSSPGAPSSAPQQESQLSAQSERYPQQRTLNSTMTARTAPVASDLTDEQRMRRALDILQRAVGG